MNGKLLKRSGPAGGFTLIEGLVVTAVIAVLAFMAVPSLISAVPNFQARKAAEATSSLMYMARMTASGTQKPTRAVVDCRNDACRMSMYTANFDKDGKLDLLNPWSQITTATRNVNRKVGIAADASSTHVAGNNARLYWAVFMPKGGLVAYSHNPFTLVVKPEARNYPSWTVSVDNITGGAAARRNVRK